MTPEELIYDLAWYAATQATTGLTPNSRWDLRLDCVKSLLARAEKAEAVIEHPMYRFSVPLIFNEIKRAEELHPGWPPDIIHGAAIMVEEAGEAIQAAFDVIYNGGPVDAYKEELIQTAAMCIRALQHLYGGRP